MDQQNLSILKSEIIEVSDYIKSVLLDSKTLSDLKKIFSIL